MKIDIITIFPEFFSVLDLSLLGKAREAGTFSLRVHDLRDHTDDKHRTVDDTPYGGGAGMVMKPEPWGRAIDSVLQDATAPGISPTALPEDSAEGAANPGAPRNLPVLIVPSPAGALFKQQDARELAQREHLIFAPGRYEGIDQRVIDHYADSGLVEVRMLSLGDYVLNGGEVAVSAMIEAITRLVPGVIGNPESLTEESHEGGLLEYPSYTKPALWRDLEVPPVLLSGNHAEIARWRAEQQRERTRTVRPDLLGESGDTPA